VENLIRACVFLAVLGMAVASFAQEQTEIPAADEWYRTEYAPLYSDKPWDKADDIAAHFAETGHNHDEDGSEYNARDRIKNSLEEWKIEGWIRSELAELEYDLLNPTTAAFKAKWRDYYTGGNIGYECGWYLADYVDGKWLITEYATISCGDHGL